MRAIAKLKNGITTVRAMAHHPMLSYLLAKKKHKKAKFITHLTAKYNGQLVYDLYSTQFLSKNPYIQFAFKGGKKGDKIVFYWIDNTGESKTSSAKIR
jgi:sulfur-oxidizing protein SoxZ